MYQYSFPDLGGYWWSWLSRRMSSFVWNTQWCIGKCGRVAEVMGIMSSIWFMSQLVQEKESSWNYLQLLCKFENCFQNLKNNNKKYVTVGKSRQRTSKSKRTWVKISNASMLQNIQNQTDEWIKKMWHIYTMEYYSAIKRNEIELFVVRWMDLESVIQSEVDRKSVV